MYIAIELGYAGEMNKSNLRVEFTCLLTCFRKRSSAKINTRETTVSFRTKKSNTYEIL